MKMVLLKEVAEKCPNVPFFFFKSARLRHHLVDNTIKNIDGGRFLIDSGHAGGLYYTYPDSEVYISDVNYKRYFKN